MNDRQLLTIIKAACKSHGVEVKEFSKGWLLELQKDSVVHRIVGSNFDLNTQAAAAIARDKAATSALLKAANILHVPHTVLRSSDMQSMQTDHLSKLLARGDVVMKPLEGGKGDYVSRVSDIASARQLIESAHPMAWAASPFVDIEREVRIVIVDDVVRLAYSKEKPVVVNGLKFFNLSKGATAVQMRIEDMPSAHSRLASSSVQTLGLRCAAVDIIIPKKGQAAILEINAAFSVMRFAQTNKATYSEVAMFYDRLIVDMFAT